MCRSPPPAVGSRANANHRGPPFGCSTWRASDRKFSWPRETWQLQAEPLPAQQFPKDSPQVRGTGNGSSLDFLRQARLTVDTGVVSPLCAGAGDELRLVYLLEPRAVALNGLRVGTPYRIEWFNPVTGVRQPASQLIAERSSKNSSRAELGG